jgi:hypothetical protein
MPKDKKPGLLSRLGFRSKPKDAPLVNGEPMDPQAQAMMGNERPAPAEVSKKEKVKEKTAKKKNEEIVDARDKAIEKNIESLKGDNPGRENVIRGVDAIFKFAANEPGSINQILEAIQGEKTKKGKLVKGGLGAAWVLIGEIGTFNNLHTELKKAIKAEEMAKHTTLNEKALKKKEAEIEKAIDKDLVGMLTKSKYLDDLLHDPVLWKLLEIETPRIPIILDNYKGYIDTQLKEQGFKDITPQHQDDLLKLAAQTSSHIIKLVNLSQAAPTGKKDLPEPIKQERESLKKSIVDVMKQNDNVIKYFLAKQGVHSITDKHIGAIIDSFIPLLSDQASKVEKILKLLAQAAEQTALPVEHPEIVQQKNQAKAKIEQQMMQEVLGLLATDQAQTMLDKVGKIMLEPDLVEKLIHNYLAHEHQEVNHKPHNQNAQPKSIQDQLEANGISTSMLKVLCEPMYPLLAHVLQDKNLLQAALAYAALPEVAPGKEISKPEQEAAAVKQQALISSIASFIQKKEVQAGISTLGGKVDIHKLGYVQAGIGIIYNNEQITEQLGKLGIKEDMVRKTLNSALPLVAQILKNAPLLQSALEFAALPAGDINSEAAQIKAKKLATLGQDIIKMNNDSDFRKAVEGLGTLIQDNKQEFSQVVDKAIDQDLLKEQIKEAGLQKGTVKELSKVGLGLASCVLQSKDLCNALISLGTEQPIDRTKLNEQEAKALAEKDAALLKVVSNFIKNNDVQKLLLETGKIITKNPDELIKFVQKSIAASPELQAEFANNGLKQNEVITVGVPLVGLMLQEKGLLVELLDYASTQAIESEKQTPAQAKEAAAKMWSLTDKIIKFVTNKKVIAELENKEQLSEIVKTLVTVNPQVKKSLKAIGLSGENAIGLSGENAIGLSGENAIGLSNIALEILPKILNEAPLSELVAYAKDSSNLPPLGSNGTVQDAGLVGKVLDFASQQLHFAELLTTNKDLIADSIVEIAGNINVSKPIIEASIDLLCTNISDDNISKMKQTYVDNYKDFNELYQLSQQPISEKRTKKMTEIAMKLGNKLELANIITANKEQITNIATQFLQTEQAKGTLKQYNINDQLTGKAVPAAINILEASTRHFGDIYKIYETYLRYDKAKQIPNSKASKKESEQASKIMVKDILALLKKPEMLTQLQSFCRDVIKPADNNVTKVLETVITSHPTLRMLNIKPDNIVNLLSDPANVETLLDIAEAANNGSYVSAFTKIIRNKDLYDLAKQAINDSLTIAWHMKVVPNFWKEHLVEKDVIKTLTNLREPNTANNTEKPDLGLLLYKKAAKEGGLLGYTLKGSDFSGLNLGQANFENYTINNFNFKETVIGGKFDGSFITNTDFSKTVLKEGVSFKNVTMDEESFKTLLPAINKLNKKLTPEKSIDLTTLTVVNSKGETKPALATIASMKDKNQASPKDLGGLSSSPKVKEGAKEKNPKGQVQGRN